ncbi:MAG: hypothetical protein ACP5UA_01825 [Candidatus Hydrogenedens sp.]
MKKTITFFSILIILSMFLSCATVKGWISHDSRKLVAQKQVSREVAHVPTKEEYIQELQQIVNNEIKSAMAIDKNYVYHKKPYFWKNYSSYNNTEGPFEINIQETDSKSKPYIAKIELEKTMYYTKLHRSKRDAEEDTNLIRSSGKETLTYELRNGRWTKLGSLFVPEQTEKKVGDTWVPLKEEEIQKEQPEEPKQGWLNRIRSWIF